MEHKHNFQHIKTRFIAYCRRSGGVIYQRIDEFYCSECCNVIEKITKEEYRHSIPEWFVCKDCEEKWL